MKMLKTKSNFEKLKNAMITDLNEVKGKISYGSAGIETVLDRLAAKYEQENKDGEEFSYKKNITGEDWIDYDKTSGRTTINHVSWLGFDFYVKVDESRAGDYHSDFMHSCDNFVVLSGKEFNAPKVVFSTSIDEVKINFLSNQKVQEVSATGESATYIDFKSAMKSIKID